jgi:DNA-binding transcriptional ArsR family regulator
MDVELNRLFEKVAGYFTLLGEPTRLKILNALCEAERSGASQTNVSRHLNLMYGKGVLARRRAGPMTYYSIVDPNVVALCRTACVQVASSADDETVNSRAVRRFMPQA